MANVSYFKRRNSDLASIHLCRELQINFVNEQSLNEAIARIFHNSSRRMREQNRKCTRNQKTGPFVNQGITGMQFLVVQLP